MDPAWVSHVTNELSQMRQEIVALRNEVNALNNDASTDLRREVNAIWDQFRLSFDSIIAIRNEMLLKFALVDNYHAIHYNNKLILSGDRNLAPLRSIINFKPIPGFPTTVDDIDHLTANAVDTILDHLDDKRDGLLFERKERLKSIIGLVKNAPELTPQHELVISAAVFQDHHDTRQSIEQDSRWHSSFVEQVGQAEVLKSGGSDKSYWRGQHIRIS
ncbi:hypothetical protein DBV05_g11180 [Lasiodiplodia theobromae]|uniref:Uncharacterized protein n=1 Tax=Lasiodiplodia theobromae TaxID=45133 RepID=A0A5N5CXS0_9PEZI|nr:hypothetical protein DBV05_g11180 [Lasiodiplodia theobromae]